MREENYYEFQLSMELLSYEIERLSTYVHENSICYYLLEQKLQKVSDFITDQKNVEIWNKWNHSKIFQQCANQVRNVVIPALSELEKYQALQVSYSNPDTQYIKQLNAIVLHELQNVNITEQSKVLFIGAGSFPTTALAIAKETGAQVLGVDIDQEAVSLGKNVVEKFRFGNKVSLTAHSICNLAFVRQTTHVIVASLVPEKQQLLKKLSDLLQKNAIVIVRYGNGIKSLFNYPFRSEGLCEWQIIDVLEKRENMYDSIIVQKG